MDQYGPDGTFPFGIPVNAIDKGGCYAHFRVVKKLRVAMMDFGTMVTWMVVPPDEAKQHAKMFREKLAEAFGNLSYNAAELPLRIVANKQKMLIETYMPQPLSILAANPELFLAWAEKLDAAADELLEHLKRND